MFAPGSVWNTRLAADAPLDPASAEVMADFREQMTRYLPWMNTTKYSVPVYVVPANQATTRVRDADDGELNRAIPYAWGDVPLPARAAAAGPAGGDGHLVIWQPSSDTMWEFYRFSRTSTGPQAYHGARISGVSTNPGSLPSPWGATASGIPLAAGLVTARDIERGRIDHALAIGVPEMRRGIFRAPATRTDGYVERATAPMMGSRLRLDPTLDVDALGLTPLARMLAHAAQDYGLVMRDTSGAVVFYGEDPLSIGRDPFVAPLNGVELRVALGAFPWDRLQLIGQ